LKHIVSYGGGVNSTAMIIWMIEHNQQIDHIVFCDTGAELPETLEYVNIFGQWLQQYGLHIEIIGRPEGLYDYCTRKQLIPFRQFRWCTEKFKIIPFNEFIQKYMPALAYIGFDAGEEGRVLNSEKPFIGKNCKKKKFPYDKRYPLFQNGIDRAGCMDMIRKAGLPEE
jgi:3'-phosphoadenosine 5'-phosphosulfate sulfotransferase (PAPS reductase)/FAD synthetase